MPSARAVLFLVLIAVVYVHTAASAPKASPRVRVVQKIPVGHTPQSLTLTPDGTELYVTLRDTESLVVISTNTRQITHRLTICREPWTGVAVPDGSKIMIGCRGAVAIISVADKHVEIVRCCGWVLDIAVTRDGRTVYLAGERAGLFHMDLPTRKTRLVHATPAPVALALTPDERFLYVNYRSGGPGGRPGHDAIGKFDAHTGAFLLAITGLANVGGPITISPNGHYLWANGQDACLSRRYDHAGCLVAPAGVINIVDLSADRLARSLPWIRVTVPDRVVFAPQKPVALVVGAATLFCDAHTFEVLGVGPQQTIFSWQFLPDGRHAFTCFAFEQGVTLLEVNL